MAKGILVRPIERAVFGGGGGGGVSVAGLVFDGVAAAVAAAVVAATVVGLLMWPKSWANLTSFHIPTEELTKKVDANVVIPAMA